MGGEGRCAMKALEVGGKGVWVWGTSLLRSQLGSPPLHTLSALSPLNVLTAYKRN